ncbi:MAG: hypothetical protein U0228_00395 [Myxococcaceae bacterium]
MRPHFLVAAALALATSACRTAYSPELLVAPVRDVQLDVTGTWNTHWDEYLAVVTLTQQGAHVTATYTTTARPSPGEAGTLEGSLEGTLEGNVLRGTWTEGGDRFGRFRWVFRTDGRSFEGAWGHASLEDDGGPWAGTR